MLKGRRYFEAGLHYHLTHRCHGGSFLLGFACDRNKYRYMLRDLSKAYRVPLLGCCITSNHFHILVTSPGQGGISTLWTLWPGILPNITTFAKGVAAHFEAGDIMQRQ